MTALALALMPGATTLDGGGGEAAPTTVRRHAVRLLGPGHSTGATGAATTSAGTPRVVNVDVTNESGLQIDTLSAVTSNWYLTSTATAAGPNDVPTSIVIQFPSGTPVGTITWGGNSTGTTVAGSDLESDDVTLSTPIPAGSNFRVVVTTTLTNGQASITQNNGLTGVRSYGARTGRREAIFAVGDSIMTNNGAQPYSAAATRCAAIQMSISGTTAASYATGTNFDRQVALAQKLGCTRFFCDFSANDLGNAANDAADVLAAVDVLAGKANAAGIKWTQTTSTPHTSRISFSLLSIAMAGGVAVATLVTAADALALKVNWPIELTGQSQSAYNGFWFVTAIDTVAGTFTFQVPAALAASSTGGAVRSYGWSLPSPGQARFNVNYDFNASGQRSLFNAAVRGGRYDGGYCEWADGLEASRDAGAFAVGGEVSLLPSPQMARTVNSVAVGGNIRRFTSTHTYGANIPSGGFVIWVTATQAALVGTRSTVNGSGSNGDTTLTADPAATITVGDTFIIVPASISATDDGQHPRVATGTAGGQAILNAQTTTWMNASLQTGL